MRLERALWSLPRIVVAVAVPTLLQIAPIAGMAAAGQKQIDEGRTLFLHEWSAQDPLSPEGDGLGPLFNARSCVACHNLAGTGGAGDNDHNVEILSLVPAPPLPGEQRNSLRTQAGKVHPAFLDGDTSALVHLAHTHEDYKPWREKLLGLGQRQTLDGTRAGSAAETACGKYLAFQSVVSIPEQNGVQLRLTRRNTPALFGAGLIDSIPERVIVRFAELQPQRFPGLQGRVARTADGSVGRFGWRGQVPDLREFVLTACAMEIGLQNARHPQARDPLDRKTVLDGEDLSNEQCDAIVEFVRSLPAPWQNAADDHRQANQITRGEKLFETIGCAGCHVKELGPVKGIYSDLLLHDMGSSFTDPTPTRQESSPGERMTVTAGSGYGGSMGTAMSASRAFREWRTPPLWGVRDSAPYLHDGRAYTLEGAIVAHGGEADSSARRFEKLQKKERSQVLAFLQSLAAP